MAFALKRHDTLPALRVVISDDAGYPLDLTSATGVTFSMRLSGATTLTISSAAAVIEDAENGVVAYYWQAADVDTAGSYVGELEITTPEGKQSFPSASEPPLRIVIDADLNNA
jgi:hypothetical protein